MRPADPCAEALDPADRRRSRARLVDAAILTAVGQTRDGDAVIRWAVGRLVEAPPDTTPDDAALGALAAPS